MAAAIKRVGRIYVREDGVTVVDGWHIEAGINDPKPEVPEFTQGDWFSWLAHLEEQRRRIETGTVEPPDPDTEIFDGWTLRELAALSVELGEGAVLDVREISDGE